MVASEADVEAEASLTGKQEVISYSAGGVIFDEGSSERLAYIIHSGHVEIRHGDAVLERLDPGNIFGEMALIDPTERSACAIAIDDVGLVSLDQRAFLTLLGKQPKFALNILRILTRRLRRTGDRKFH